MLTTSNMQAPSPDLTRRPILSIVAISAAIASFLVVLIYFKGKVAAPDWVAALPAANASFNSLSAMCLILGYINIRRGNRVLHMRFIFTASGWIRPVYFFILISHIGLSMVALPLILASLWYGLRNQFAFHRRVARWTFPIWLYVSVTGVIVYFFLKSFTA